MELKGVEEQFKARARKLVRKFSRGDRVALCDDLIQEGWLGFLKAQEQGKSIRVATLAGISAMSQSWFKWNWGLCLNGQQKGRELRVVVSLDLDKHDELRAPVTSNYEIWEVCKRIRGQLTPKQEQQFSRFLANESSKGGHPPIMKKIRQVTLEVLNGR